MNDRNEEFERSWESKYKSGYQQMPMDPMQNNHCMYCPMMYQMPSYVYPAYYGYGWHGYHGYSHHGHSHHGSHRGYDYEE